jgi:cell division protein ZipA
MSAGSLRIVLLIIGLFILAAIYFYSRWRSQKQVNDIFRGTQQGHPDVLLGDHDFASQSRKQIDPILPDIGLPSTAGTPKTTDTSGTTTKSPTGKPQETAAKSAAPVEKPATPTSTIGNKRLKLIVMHLVPKSGKQFHGAAVLKALQAHKLRFGEMNIFHRLTPVDDKDMAIFSVANMVKPGTLIPEQLDNARLPGISFFLKLPAPIDSLKAYDDMLHCAQHMASTLEGDIKDEEFMTLSREKIALQRAQLF